MLAEGFGAEKARFKRVISPLCEVTLREIPAAVGQKASEGAQRFDPSISKLLNFEQPFSCLSNVHADRVLDFFERYDLDGLTGRMAFGETLDSTHQCSYGLGDWEEGISGLLQHQRQNREWLLATGYAPVPFTLSPWLDRNLSCLYPVKFRYDFPGSEWRTQKNFGEFGTVGDPTTYVDAPYYSFVSLENARRLDSAELREVILSFKERLFRRLLHHLKERGSVGIPVIEALDIAVDCLSYGSKVLGGSIELSFFKPCDQIFEDHELLLPVFKGSSLFLKPGGMSEVVTLVQEVTMGLALRHWERIRPRLSSYPSESGLGVRVPLRTFYEDYVIYGGRDFEPLYLEWRSYQAKIESYREEFRLHWQRLLNEWRPEAPVGTIVATTDTVLLGKGTPSTAKLQIVEADFSLIYLGVKYKLPDKQWTAIEFLVSQLKRGVPSINKHAIYDLVKLDSSASRDCSVRKWFRLSGGDSKRLAQTGLLKTDRRGECSLSVSPIEVDYIPAIDDEESEI